MAAAAVTARPTVVANSPRAVSITSDGLGSGVGRAVRRYGLQSFDGDGTVSVGGELAVDLAWYRLITHYDVVENVL